MDKKKLSHSSLQSSVTSVLAALLCILIGLIVGFLVLLAINPAHAWGDGFVRILKGGFYDAPYGVGKMLANAAPLVMTGLSVGFAFKTGLFNIGAAGQYTLGAYGALYCAIMLKMPWFVCLLAATLLGGIWGAIPGFFKAYFNINEVITSIMFNWIGLYLVNELVYQNGTGPMYDVRNTYPEPEQEPGLCPVHHPGFRPEQDVPDQQHHHCHLPGSGGGHPDLGGAEQDHLRL